MVVAVAVNIVLEPKWPLGAEGEDHFPSGVGSGWWGEEECPGREYGEQDTGVPEA